MSALGVTPERALTILRGMLLIRRFEERSAELYTQQKIRGFLHLCVGEEALSVGAFQALTPEDNIVAAYREHGHALMRGIPAASVMAEMFARANGCSKGRGGSMHLFSAERRFFGGYAIVAGGLPLAVGLALADKLQQRSRVTACFFGDGATDEGEFHEALNLASLWQLPVLFLCENNYYAMGTALARHRAEPEIVKQPPAYRIPSEAVDGMDVLAVLEATAKAAAAVRRGGGPQFLELRTYRFRAHSMYDPDRYRDKEEVERWKERDPIALFSRRLRDEKLLDDDVLARLESDVAGEVARAVAAAEAGPIEPVADLTKYVYARELV